MEKINIIEGLEKYIIERFNLSTHNYYSHVYFRSRFFFFF